MPDAMASPAPVPRASPAEGNVMTAAVIGLIGAALGALITFFGGQFNAARQARRDEVTWRRDKRAEAFDGALRHMLRAANLRSEFTGGNGGAVLKTEHQREFFDDLVQAQFWLHTAARYCSGHELAALRDVMEVLDTHITRLVSGVRFDQKDFSIWHVLQECIQDLSNTGRVDGTMLARADERQMLRASGQQIIMNAAPETPPSAGAAEALHRLQRQLPNIPMASSDSEAVEVLRQLAELHPAIATDPTMRKYIRPDDDASTQAALAAQTRIPMADSRERDRLERELRAQELRRMEEQQVTTAEALRRALEERFPKGHPAWDYVNIPMAVDPVERKRLQGMRLKRVAKDNAPDESGEESQTEIVREDRQLVAEAESSRESGQE